MRGAGCVTPFDHAECSGGAISRKPLVSGSRETSGWLRLDHIRGTIAHIDADADVDEHRMTAGRRKFFRVAAACTVAAWQLSVRAQQQQRPIRVAILSPGMNEQRSVFRSFRKRLRDLGYEEGRDLVLTFHLARGIAPLSTLARAIARAPVSIVLADGGAAAQAMQAESRTIPILAVTGDPLAIGIAATLARPGGNVTGISTMSADLGLKQLDLLREILPSAKRIGLIVPTSMVAGFRRGYEDRARSLGVDLRRITIGGPADVERELAPAMLAELDGLVVPPNAYLAASSDVIVRRINASGKPAIYGDRDFVEAGGLAFYGIDIDDAFRRAADLLDSVIKGAAPAETPYEQATRVALVLNLKTAKSLHLAIPSALLLRADDVVE